MQTEVLKVTGMTCGGCVGNVTRSLRTVPGVADVRVALAAGEATVRYDERLTSLAELNTAVEGAGYGVVVTNAAESPAPKGGCCG